MQILKTALFVTAISSTASSMFAASAPPPCAEIKSLQVVAMGDIQMDYGQFYSDDYWFRFTCGPWETAPLGDISAAGLMWYEDANSDNMAASWSVANGTLHDSGFELYAFSYGLGRYTGLPHRDYGNGDSYASATGDFELTQPARVTIDMNVISAAYHYAGITWERALERIEWRDHGELGSGYMSVETIMNDKYQNVVRGWNDYDEYVTGQTGNRIITIDLEPGLYRLRTNTKVVSSPVSHGMVATFDHSLVSTCDISFSCIEYVAGDLNHDAIVDGADLSMLLGDWGSARERADLDGSGRVDGADLTLLLGAWD